MLLVLGCAFAIVRKLFGKKRHGEKNKPGGGGVGGGGGGGGGLRRFFKGAGGGGAQPTDLLAANKLQPDLDALEANMEQNEKEQAEVSERKLVTRVFISYAKLC